MSKEYKASINIFQKEIEKNSASDPYVPKEVFSAAQIIIQAQSGCELIRTGQGVYLVQYSDTGPFRSHVDGWLPVYIIKLRQWNSGGITADEMHEYDSTFEPPPLQVETFARPFVSIPGETDE